MNPGLLAVSIVELESIFADLGEPKYRAKQIIEQLYRNHVCDIRNISNLPKTLRERLVAVAGDFPVTVAESEIADDGTEKLLLSLCDGAQIEMVLIPSPERITFCLSTQVGCPVGCRFCASGALGLERNLTAAEILGELFVGANKIGRWPDNVVFMGIGEGLLNTKNLFTALEFMTGREYVGMSPRRIVVSTSGIVPGMMEFANLRKEFTLAVSLHAPDEATREKIIPGKIRYPISEIMAAVDYYLETAGRMVTLEYTLLDGVNDTLVAARALGIIAKKHHCKVNLIACNRAVGDFKRPPRNRVDAFFEVLDAAGVHVTVRVEKGGDSAAACGQLRLRSGVLTDKFKK